MAVLSPRPCVGWSARYSDRNQRLSYAVPIKVPESPWVHMSGEGASSARKSIERISALLAKAERTDNAAEADAYLMKAQALATAGSVDLAFARAHTQKTEARQRPEIRTITIGEKGKRANQHLIALFVVVAQANYAQVDIAGNSTYVMVYGMPGDLDAIEALFASVAVQMTFTAQAWLALGSWRNESYVSSKKSGGLWTRSTKPHTAQTARVSFYRAYIVRIEERITLARDQARDQVFAEHGKGRAGRGEGEVVLRQKSAEIRDFHRANSGARGAWGGYSGAVRSDKGSAGAAGRHAASNARLAAQRALPGKSAVTGSTP